MATAPHRARIPARALPPARAFAAAGAGGAPSDATWVAATADRVAGGLWGLCVGDCLGATCEFMSAEEISSRLGRHSEITGGGAFAWAPGEGTDDSDLAIALLAPTPRAIRSSG